MSWPVINPLSRYRHAKRAEASANPPPWPKSIIGRRSSYWQSEANMSEGSPTMALERGEKLLTPPAIWFQTHGDIMHDYKDTESAFDGNEPQRFCAAPRYRRLDRPGNTSTWSAARLFAGPVEVRPHVRAGWWSSSKSM